jgi:hypothetical protein
MKYLKPIVWVLIAVAVWFSIDYLRNVSDTQTARPSWGIAKDSPIK